MKPLVIAHRGASGDAPENTLKAFRLAAEQKADGIELDILLSHDGTVVVTHDENLMRLTGEPILTRQAPLSVLKQLDFGEGEKIPTLDELFEECDQKFSIINVEIKSTGTFTDGIEKALVKVIDNHQLRNKILVSSFNPLHLLRIKRLAPDIQRGYLIFEKPWIAQLTFWVYVTQAISVNLSAEWCEDIQRFEKYKKLTSQSWVWTVNDEVEMKKWIGRGVDAIITNYPERLRKILANL